MKKVLTAINTIWYTTVSCAGNIAYGGYGKGITMNGYDLDFYFFGSNNGFPFLDVYIENEKMVVEFALAGFKRDEFEVRVANNILNLKGEKKSTSREYHRKGIKGGKFDVSYKIDSKYVSDPDASYEDGILRLVFDVAEDKKPKLINVK